MNASIIIPVNAQGDMENVWNIVDDLGMYKGYNDFEIVLLVNNFEGHFPELKRDRRIPSYVKIFYVSNVREPGKAAPICARVAGMRGAGSNNAISFDADCRIPYPSQLIDWYISQLENPYIGIAYTHCDYYDYENANVIKARILVHHLSRWIKRNIFRIPTTRGGSWGVRIDEFLPLWNEGYIADDLHVGPVMKKMVGEVSYSSEKEQRVLTSGRVFNGEKSWRHLAWYLTYRLLYNIKALKIRKNIAEVAPVKGGVRKYKDNKVIK